MNSSILSASVTAFANAVAKEFDTDELAVLACIFVQLGDTLATIVAQRALCENQSQN